MSTTSLPLARLGSSHDAPPRRPGILAALFVAAVAMGLGPSESSADPARVLASSEAGDASGSAGNWDFSATDLTFKRVTGDLWVLDAYTDRQEPEAVVFREEPSGGLERVGKVLIEIPSELQEAPVLGIAEVPHGELEGRTFVLVDRTFGTRNPAEPFMLVVDDDGRMVDGIPAAPVVGLPAGSRISTLAVNPEEEEIAVYDIATHEIHLLDLAFRYTGESFPVFGFPSFFVGPWGLGNQLRGAGAGLTYDGPDHVLVTSGFIHDFETRFALRYALREGGKYTGEAVDLSGVVAGMASDTNAADLAFVGLASGEVDGQPVLAALNFGEDRLYVFGLDLASEPQPVVIEECAPDPETGRLVVRWALDSIADVDSIRIFENGVQTAVVSPTDTEYAFPSPLLGKTFVEVATETDGAVSQLRRICQVENSDVPSYDDDLFPAYEFPLNPEELVYDVAVTRRPETPEDFRAYALTTTGGQAFTVAVFNHQLQRLPNLELEASSLSQLNGRMVRGIALARYEGEDRLAILDVDGFSGSGVPSAALFRLDGTRPEAGPRDIQTIDLSSVGAGNAFLIDWDADLEGNFIAGAVDGYEYYLIRLELEDESTLRGTYRVPIPHRQLTPFDERPLIGVGVSVLPSGNVLVAGADTFAGTYTEALLVTPLGPSAASSAKLVGYAQGLFALNQFSAYPYGPDTGANALGGFAAAFFADPVQEGEGTGVSYLSVPEMVLIQGPNGLILVVPGELLIHSTNACSHPDLRAEQIVRSQYEIQSMGSDSTGPRRPSFADEVPRIDYFYYVLNTSRTRSATLLVSAELDGALVPGSEARVVVPPGRYYRASLEARREGSIDLTVRNEGSSLASVDIIVGAMGVTGEEPLFRRGDCDGDGIVQITDAIFGLNWLFVGGPEPPCEDACDSDDDGAANITDMVILLTYLFNAGTPPAAPGPETCGVDPTPDDALAPCAYPPQECR